MSKKNLAVRVIIMLLLAGMLLPVFSERVKNESLNNDVMFALNYNNANMVLSDDEFDRTLDENMKNGVKTLIIAEESINSLISAGYITGIKYNVLCHKYDDESEDIIKQLSDNRKIHNDSYVLITKRPECKEYLNKWISAKYSSDEYVKKTTALNADVYVLYEGVNDAWKVTTGFDEKKIEYAHKKGFRIVLSMMAGAYSKTDYIDYISQIIDKYDIKFINLKEGHKDQSQAPNAEKNYKALCKMIKEKKLHLILTENQTQLSNQKPIGYDELVKSAEGRVLRGYETVDFDLTNKGATKEEKRYYQILNSVVDRNIRFVTINQLTNGTDTLGEKSEKTNLATKRVMDKLESIGFNVKDYDTVYDYSVNTTQSSAIAMIIMIIMGLTIIEWLLGKSLGKLEIIAAIGAVLSIGFTYKAPIAIVSLYPTLFAAIAPCFAITAAVVYVRDMRNKLTASWLTLSTVLLTVAVLGICAMIQSSLLAGLDYYINSVIFRGIKISLLLPIAYTILVYGIIFVDKSDNYFAKIVKILNARIKVYWMVIGALIGGIGAIYLIRSGNVSEISPIENFMRNTITEIMYARPRTKEFLIGWPCLILFVYYIKNTNCKIMQWCTAVGSSILFASIMNTFCHVFTSVQIMYTRSLNGFIVGAIVSAFAFVLNLVIIRAVKYFIKKGNQNG